VCWTSGRKGKTTVATREWYKMQEEMGGAEMSRVVVAIKTKW